MGSSRQITGVSFIGLLLNASVSHAEFGPEYFYRDWKASPYKTEVVEKGPGPIKNLPVKRNLSSADESIVAKAKHISENQPILALILIDGSNNVIFEAYAGGADGSSRIKGWSMTKSLVSVALGQSICDGTVKSLDEPASRYSKSLQGTAYGDATFRELLTMASSGTRPTSEGMPLKNMNYHLGGSRTRTLRHSFSEFGVNHPDPSTKGSFTYKGLDTAAISIALADGAQSKFSEILSRNVWTKIGAEDVAEAVIDRNGDVLAESGFGATARDWGRFAIYVRDSRVTDDCLGKYIRSATGKQIENRSKVGPAFAGYGYQFWVANRFISTESAWLNGYGGQRIGIDLRSGKVIVLLSAKSGAVMPTYKLFDEWTR